MLFLFTVLHTFPNSCQFCSHPTSPSEAASVCLLLLPAAPSPNPTSCQLAEAGGRRLTQFCGLFFPAATGNAQNSDHVSCGDEIKKNFSTSKPRLNVSGLDKVPSLCSKSCHRHWEGVCPCGGAEHRLAGGCVSCSSGLCRWNLLEHQLQPLLDAALIKQNGPAPGPSGQASTWQL